MIVTLVVAAILLLAAGWFFFWRRRKLRFLIYMRNELIGEFQWLLMPEYSQKAIQCIDEDDENFTEVFLLRFLTLLQAVLTCSDRKIKMTHKKAFAKFFEDFNDRMIANYPKKNEEFDPTQN